MSMIIAMCAIYIFNSDSPTSSSDSRVNDTTLHEGEPVFHMESDSDDDTW